ncbi:MAG: polyamine ABC transporter substrate-binding protein [Xanthomonadales bacterium]|nr:Putrescine-binding periplasmic protein [Xanthomonadales bacterium]MCC6592903.1 polyamine ABC transporter substrate-binding protein [Xanthomonadales bacterium]MCE7930768.1 polyamine ABC transporter substrate-binding protein [Xanthomonadales bacterium PRO6]
MKLRLSLLALACAGILSCGKDEAPSGSTSAADSKPAEPAKPAEEPKVLNVLNWSDYIAEDTIANFEKETGIDVTYDVFDSNEVLEAKLMTGNSGYDVVVPSLTFLARQIQAGVFMPLDKSKLPNYANLDPQIQALIAQNDKGNTYSANYMWGTTGIAYNVDKVKERLGEAAPVDDLKIFFEPDLVSKFTDCGVYVLDTPSEILPMVLDYLGEEPNSFDPAVIQKAVDRMLLIRPHITQFHSSQVIDALANGDACLALAWSGDVIQAANRAKEAGKGVQVGYAIPKQGAPVWFDMLAIPKDAAHPNNAHVFIDYILRPDVTANIQNYVSYASGNAKAKELIDPAILNDPRVYPSPEVQATLYNLAVIPPEVDRIFNRAWTTIKTSQ